MPDTVEPATPPPGLRWLRIALLLIACAVYVGVALASPGYDDEFYNIRFVESKPLFSLLWFVEHQDVHPPGQYLINAVLYALLGAWPLVRAVGALACALAVFRFAALDRLSTRSAVILQFLLVAMHPALLMWCTGLRWTTYFVPLFLLAILWVRHDTPSRWRFWPVLGLFGLALFYLNYLALLLVPLLVLVALYRRRERLAVDWPAIALSVAAAAPFVLLQLYFLARFQLAFAGAQRSEPVAALAGVAQGLMVHSGVFPASIVGIVTFAAFLALAGWLVLRRREAVLRDPELWLAGAGVLLLVVTGLAGKWRNLAPLVPLVFAKFVPLIGRTPSRVALGLAWVLAASNLVGCLNVVRHWDTSKGSWNLPVAATAEATRAAAAACGGGTPVVIALDPVLAAGLAQRTPFTVIPSHPRTMPGPIARDGDYCLLQARTYDGALPPAIRAKVERSLPAGRTAAQVGRDPYAALKRRLDARVPDHYVEVIAYGRMRRVPDYLDYGRKLARAAATGIAPVSD